MTQNDMVAVDNLVREIAGPGRRTRRRRCPVRGSRRQHAPEAQGWPQDVGKVIGKQGRTARSVRTIRGAVSKKLHHRCTLDILEEDDEG